MSTPVSASTAPPPVPAHAERPSAGAQGATRSTSWRVYAALAGASLALGALSLLYPSTPSYDPWGWLLWGRELLHFTLNTVGANTFKPLPVLFTLPFALFGKAQPDLWLVVARAGAIFSVAMAFRLAFRLTLWFGTTTGGRLTASRAISYGPAVLAGAIAALMMVIYPQYIRDAALGYSECLTVGLVLLAIDRQLDDKPRQSFVIGFFAALDRPEMWPFWGLYGLYLWRRDPGARKLISALFALVPALWFLPELWGSGALFRGVARDLHPSKATAASAACPFCTVMKNAAYESLFRITVPAALLAVGTAIAIWRALRRRTSALGPAVRVQAHRPEGIVLALAVTAILWFIETAAMTQYGFSGNRRYLVIGEALVLVVGAVGWGLVAWKLGELLGRWIRPAPGAAVAVVAVAAFFLFFSGWVVRNAHLQARALDHALRYQAELRHDLKAVIHRAGGARAVLACGRVSTENYQVPMVAWYLGVESVAVSNERPPIANQGAPPNPRVILQTRVTGTAPLRPLIPASVRYTEITQRSFRLFEHCG